MALFFALLLLGTPLAFAVMNLLAMRKESPAATRQL
jgi:hypothetical protein